MTSPSDICYDRLELEWAKACERKDARTLGQVLLAIIRYFRHLSGGAAIHSPLVTDKLALLEALVPEMSSRDFLSCANAIEFARRHVAETGEQFGRGFAEDPSDAELRAIGPALRPKKADQRVGPKKTRVNRQRAA